MFCHAANRTQVKERNIMTFFILWGIGMTLAITAVLWRWICYREKPHLWNTLYGLLFITVSAVLTRHALTANNALPQPTIHAQPNLTLLYLGIYYTLVIWVSFVTRDVSRFDFLFVWPGLFLFSSYIYFRTFITAEQGVVYPLFYLLALGYVFLGIGTRRSTFYSFRGIPRSLLASLAIFLFLGLASTVTSYSIDESQSQYIPILCFALLPFLLSGDLSKSRSWHSAVIWCVLSIGGILVTLAGIQFGFLTWKMGFLPALQYRLFIADIGPNWISYSLVVLVPLSIASMLASTSYTHKALWGLVVLGILITIAYTQSDQGFSGWIALILSGIVFSFLLLWVPIKRFWQQHPFLGWSGISLGIGLIILLVLGGISYARQTNSYSIYARLYHWRVTLYQIGENPWLGSGLNVRHATTVYSEMMLSDQYFKQFMGFLPYFELSPAAQRLQLINHAHNLFLELAAGAGIPALLAFLWFLGELINYGLRAFRQSSGQTRLFIAGCIAGIFASLGWGLIDVMEYSPPFFTTPTWILIGLILAAPRAFGLQMASEKSAITEHIPGFMWHALRTIFIALCPLITVIAIILPVLGNIYYRPAYIAYQEHRWTDAAEGLGRASIWEPFNAKYQQLRAESLINMRRYDEAINAYNRAVRLKRDFAPYHSQLGWLYWLQGDLRQATIHFQKAIEMDPQEAWRSGLHADLALAYVAQGRIADAIPLFKRTIELGPEFVTVPGLVWMPMLSQGGAYDVVLDPVYFISTNGKRATSPLQERILVHLGETDYTQRLFNYDHKPSSSNSSFSFNLVLDAIQIDYLRALIDAKQEAPRLLATIAEAARLAGLDTRAEQAYRRYQISFPASEYGFRELGSFYDDKGNLEKAQSLLEQATEVSPTDIDSWIELADLYLKREMDDAADRALKKAYHLSPLDVRIYRLRSKLYQQQAEFMKAANELDKSLVLVESIQDRLTLADLYNSLGLPQLAAAQCLQIANTVIRSWPPSLNPQLHQIGECLAEDPNLKLSDLVLSSNKSSDEIRQILIGHVNRAQGQLNSALTAYQAAVTARKDEGGPHYFLGETYQVLGKLELAESEYQLATQLDPEESIPLLALGHMQWSQGHLEAALASFYAAVEVTPGWGEAHMALGNALSTLDTQAEAATQYQLAQLTDGDIHEGVFYDFVAHLAEAVLEPSDANIIHGDYFTINSERKRVLYMHPDAHLKYLVDLTGFKNPSALSLIFDLGMSPESWTKEGDGVTFAIYIVSGQGNQRIFSAYIDPKHNQIDRRWYPYAIDLRKYAGQKLTLLFETSAGPAGDYRYDWAGWGEPRLLKP